MEEPEAQQESVVTIDLRQPYTAALYAWLLPGAGHIYQRRYGKGFLFMVSILALYIFGMIIGDCRVVYFNKVPGDRRWQYALQFGVGIPAFPALIQYYRYKDPNYEPFWDGRMAPPDFQGPKTADGLAQLHEEMTIRFELGTLYTVVAGLLNILVIYDAYSGPMVYESPNEEKSDKDKKS